MTISILIASAISMCGLMILDFTRGEDVSPLTGFMIIAAMSYCVQYVGIAETLFLICPFLITILYDRTAKKRGIR